MKAVVLHGAGDLRIDELPDPELPPGGLVIAPVAVGICGSDVRTWQHGSPRLAGPQVPGHETAGRVVASAVEGIPIGTVVAVCPGVPCGRCRACRRGAGNLCPDRKVLGHDLPGGMAERQAIPAAWIDGGCVVTLDATEPIERGVLIEPLHTVLNGQDQVGIRAGEHVLVLGLGPIGILHAAVASSAGATVLGVDPDPARVALATTILPSVPHGRPAAAAAVPDGFDVVIVAVGRREAVEEGLARVAPGGRVLAFGGLPPDERVLGLDMNDLHYRQRSLVGAFGGTPDTFRRAADWLARRTIDLEAVAPDRFPLDRAVDAFEHAAAGRGLKTLLLPGRGV